jgi:hypothetical protein
VGATSAPTDLNVWGTLAAALPSPPIDDDFKRGLDQAWETNAGAAAALGELALNTAKLLVLNTATFGGYGAYQAGSAIWAGYQEDGIPGALNAVNPFYHFLRAGLDTYASVAAGDHRAIGAHGLTTLVLGAAAVVGIANGVAALAEAAVARGATAGAGAQGTTKGRGADFVRPLTAADLGLAENAIVEGTLALRGGKATAVVKYLGAPPEGFGLGVARARGALANVAKSDGAISLRIETSRIIEPSGRLGPLLERFGFQQRPNGTMWWEGGL